MASTPVTPYSAKLPEPLAPVKPNVGEILKGYQDRDQELYQKWKDTGSKRDLGNLVNQLSPILHKEVHRVSGSLPTAGLMAEAKVWAAKAIQTYDPSKGTLLSTHVTNYLPKIRRSNYKYQNAARMPENKTLQFQNYTNVVNDLTEELNREPTDDEVAKKIGWTKNQTFKYRNSIFSDLIESSSARPAEYTQFNESALLMEYLLEQLTEEEKFILEKSKTMSSTQMANKLGVNINRYNYLKSKLVDKIKKIQREIGMT